MKVISDAERILLQKVDGKPRERIKKQWFYNINTENGQIFSHDLYELSGIRELKTRFNFDDSLYNKNIFLNFKDSFDSVIKNDPTKV